MKTKFSLSKTAKGLLLLVVSATLLLSSCLKDENHYSVQASVMALINAAPGSPALDFYSEGSKNFLPIDFGYDSVVSYRGAYPGFRVFGFTLHHSSQPIGSQQIYLKPGYAYSLFVTDTIGDLKLVCLTDSLHGTDSTKGSIRFANMSANAPALDLVLKGGSSTTVKNMEYTKASDFESIEPGDGYTLQLVETSNNKVLASRSNVKIEKGHIYTVWARGIYQSKSDSTKLGLSLMENG